MKRIINIVTKHAVCTGLSVSTGITIIVKAVDDAYITYKAVAINLCTVTLADLCILGECLLR